MLYLISAIVSSALVSIFMRLGEEHIRNNMTMFVANYAVCAGLSAAFMPRLGLAGGEGAPFALGLGLLSGVMYLTSFAMFRWNIRMNGIVLSSTFMKLGVLVPTVMAITLFREGLRPMQALGIAGALAAILMIQLEKAPDDTGISGGKLWLLVLLLCGGFTDSLSNVYDKLGNSALKDHYLLVTFVTAMAAALLMALRGHEHPTLKDIGFGVLIGIPNYFSARFLLLALGSVSAVVTYPVYSTLTMVVIALSGVLLFHEQISRRKACAMAVILAALVLLNL